VKWDGKTVAGVNKFGALKRTTALPSSHREGNDLSTRPSLARACQLRGHHASSVVSPTTGTSRRGPTRSIAPRVTGAVSLRDFRKDITMELLNLQGTVVAAYNIFRCWVTSYTSLPDLDANGDAIAFESITLKPTRASSAT
jgi:hypothetical protein